MKQVLQRILGGPLYGFNWKLLGIEWENQVGQCKVPAISIGARAWRVCGQTKEEVWASAGGARRLGELASAVKPIKVVVVVRPAPMGLTTRCDMSEGICVGRGHFSFQRRCGVRAQCRSGAESHEMFETQVRVPTP